MKYPRLILALIVAANCLFGVLNLAEAAVCQNKTAIVYSNGIFNDYEDGIDSLANGLRKRLIESSPAFADPSAYEYHLAYAANSNLFIDPATGEIRGPLGQLLEVTRQIRADRASVFWRWLAADPAAPQAFRDEQLRMAAEINLQAFTNDADLTGHLDGIYRPALTQGKRVLVVAHSQGNLYANAAYDSLYLEGLVGPNISYMGIVAVASPASIVASTNSQDPHVTASEDLVILGVGKTYNGDPLPGTHSNFGDIATDDPLGHNFVKYYLAGAQTRVAILNHIVATIAAMPSTTTISVADSSVTEGSGGGLVNLNFTVALCSASASGVTVNYETSDGTANSGSDYTATYGTLTIPAGTVMGTITVGVYGDEVFEPDETVMLSLYDPVNAILGSAIATGTIVDDDLGAVLGMRLFLDDPYPRRTAQQLDWHGIDYDRGLFYHVTLNVVAQPRTLETIVVDAYGSQSQSVFTDVSGMILNSISSTTILVVTSAGYSMFANYSGHSWEITRPRLDVSVAEGFTSDPLVSSYTRPPESLTFYSSISIGQGDVIVKPPPEWATVSRVGISFRYEWATNLWRSSPDFNHAYSWTMDRDTRSWEIDNGTSPAQAWASGWGLWASFSASNCPLAYSCEGTYTLGTGFSNSLLSGSPADRGIHSGPAFHRDGRQVTFDWQLWEQFPDAINSGYNGRLGNRYYPWMLKAAVVEPNAAGNPVITAVNTGIVINKSSSTDTLYAMYNDDPGLLSDHAFSFLRPSQTYISLSSANVWWLLNRPPLTDPSMPDPR